MRAWRSPGPQSSLQGSSCKNIAGLRSPHPRKLSCVKKVSQRAHKEPPGSLTSGSLKNFTKGVKHDPF